MGIISCFAWAGIPRVFPPLYRLPFSLYLSEDLHKIHQLHPQLLVLCLSKEISHKLPDKVLDAQINMNFK